MGGRSFLSGLIMTAQRKRHPRWEGAFRLVFAAFLAGKNITTLRVVSSENFQHYR
jgi:hypothetical protein